MRVKKLLKNVSLALLGIGAIGAVGYGGTKLVQHITNDTKSLNLSYDVGSLGADGKYVNDESRIYTKEKFACEGLKAVLDFDSEINYQLFYYDILDNFVSSSEVLTSGYSNESPTHGAYARIVITPTNDEDGKISFMEKYKYGNQLNVSVSKKAESNVSKKYVSYKNKVLDVVSNFKELTFVGNVDFNLNKGFFTSNYENNKTTSINVLDVTNYNKINLVKLDTIYLREATIYEFDSYDLNSANVITTKLGYNDTSVKKEELIFSKSTKVIIITTWCLDSTDVSKVLSHFTFSK